eukprot:4771610-Amphidinium_carterae.1
MQPKRTADHVLSSTRALRQPTRQLGAKDTCSSGCTLQGTHKLEKHRRAHSIEGKPTNQLVQNFLEAVFQSHPFPGDCTWRYTKRH